MSLHPSARLADGPLLEIVNIDYEKGLKCRVTKNAGPVGNGHEANLFKLGLAVLFPETSSVGMSIERKNKGAYWVLHGLPLLRPLVTGEAYPGLGSAEQRLRIRGFSVANLKRVSWQ